MSRLRDPSPLAGRFRLPAVQRRSGLAGQRNRLARIGCGNQARLAARTTFEGTRKPLRTWFRAMWWVTPQKNAAGPLGLQRVPGPGQCKTAWTWPHQLNCAMIRPGRDALSGIVEADQTQVGGKAEGELGVTLLFQLATCLGHLG